MKRPVVWSIEARNDLASLFRYLAKRNPDAAARIAQRLRETGTALGETPTGRVGRIHGIYEKVVTGLPYILAYQIQRLPDGQDAVFILRAIHTARDWQQGEWPDD